ncbi:class I SAM-dependent methyltransferase [Cereibacter sphaeroides]|uniref:SAM-dependent methyltransferase n=1 Tax=Cereibacter sphaeroides TaxID=1063 RepID=UPI001F166DE8|nr:class I SAM-dependent methyltransferase [Cereibacter sphaeroides]MCE6960227.1 class I SAM-dependent methyltransferase [Cereibacter sphaeroides]MCE6969213.1 class I SAM-dependent methyltransferase [Cereibacter sphaeroides]MCE6974838.1 class I SAM-dependent methyltransferase [Cereibacter sphaeroides]
MWDERYSAPGYLFGKEPATFVRRVAGMLPARARILCLGDGEGRNSVHLAGLGHRVAAMDASAVALEKARRLAREKGVEVDLHHADIEGWDWSRRFDAVLGIFIQFAPPPLRARIHAGIAEAVEPGGLVMLHGYAPRQVGYGTGGPPSAANMYDLAGLRADFPGWEVLVEADRDEEIAEGSAHRGISALVDFVARKPVSA